MFRRSNGVHGQQEEGTKQPQIQRSGIAKSRLSSSIRSASPSPAFAPSGQRRVSANIKSTSVSEKYTNTSINRVPSIATRSRFQRPSSGAKIEHPVTEQPRAKVLLNPRRSKTLQLAANQSRNDITKSRLLWSECTERKEQRPHSSVQKKSNIEEHQKDGKTGSKSSMNNHKVMLAVKDVLSRAVIEKGKIDEGDLGNILRDMKSRIFGEASMNDDDTSVDIDVEAKHSRSTVNTNTSSESLPLRKSKPLAGIVRKHISTHSKSLSKPYNKVYTQDELPNEHTINKQHSKDADTIMYIDLPDSDYSNFTSIVRNDRERLNRSQYKKNTVQPNTESVETERSHRDLVVGDSNMRERDTSYEFWKAAEDAKLQSYIESLIRNMNDQLCGKQPLQGIEDEFETKSTLCKSFCVCKICVSKKPPSKDNMKKEPDEGQNTNKFEINVKKNIASSNSNKQRQVQIEEERSSTNFRVLKRNKNFCPESKVNISPRHIMSGTVRYDNKDESLKNESYTIVEPGQTNEVSDDMYLKRRLKSPTRRR